MSVFVTGSTGFIGANLALKLAGSGKVVHALYRSEEKAKVLDHKNIRLFKGDILDIVSLENAIQGCNEIYHIAAFTEVWTKDKRLIFKLNVEGTINVFETALKNNVKNIVFTSTAGVFGPSVNKVINEHSIRETPYFLAYEKTKAQAEEKISSYVKKGLNIKIVNPTRVYGPGLLSKSNSVTIMIKNYVKGKWRLVPGNGKSIGNYVFIDDVVNGHILAMQNGEKGERYILGGENCSYDEFFNALKLISGKKFRLFKIPLFIMLLISGAAMFINFLFGIKPFITPALVKKFNYNWEISSNKAIHKLGYKITSLADGIQKTLNWIENE